MIIYIFDLSLQYGEGEPFAVMFHRFEERQLMNWLGLLRFGGGEWRPNLVAEVVDWYAGSDARNTPMDLGGFYKQHVEPASEFTISVDRRGIAASFRASAARGQYGTSYYCGANSVSGCVDKLCEWFPDLGRLDVVARTVVREVITVLDQTVVVQQKVAFSAPVTGTTGIVGPTGPYGFCATTTVERPLADVLREQND